MNRIKLYLTTLFTVLLVGLFAAPASHAYLNVENAGVKCRNLNAGSAWSNLSPWGGYNGTQLHSYTRYGNENVKVSYRFWNWNVVQARNEGGGVNYYYLSDRYDCHVLGSNESGYVYTNQAWGVAYRSPAW